MLKNITPHELKQKLDQHAIVLIDVREPGEHATQRIDGACLIPMNELNCKKLPHSHKPIVLHCAAGRRSEMAAQKLLAENPQLDVYSLTGGIQGWQQAGYAVCTGTRCVMSIDRQTQLAAGSLTLVGTLLGALVSPWLLLIPVVIGSGLILAGSTGWCGMAKLLARMPWNR